MDSFNKFNERKLPAMHSFNSTLGGEISEDEYMHAQKIFSMLKNRTLGDYSDFYLAIDIHLLADVFMNFRKHCARTYGLYPEAYYSLPGYSLDAMLKMTRVSIELMTDVNMISFIRKSIRGGLAVAVKRYEEANNLFMGDEYDASKPSKFLMYWDCNNLYGKAMSGNMPIGDYEWVENVQNFDLWTDSTGLYGYVLEVDIEYPHYLHDRHQDLPYLPEKVKIGGMEKLCATVFHKKKLCCTHRKPATSHACWFKMCAST